MNWDAVLSAFVAALRADTALQTLLGTDYMIRIKRANDAGLTIPSVTYQVITNPIEENTESMTVQWDAWGKTTPSLNEYALVVAIEARLRALMHWDGIDTVGGIPLWSHMVDSRDHPDPEESVAHRSLDFEYTFAKAA